MNKYFICTAAFFLITSALHLYAQDIDPASDPNVQPNSPTSLNGYQLAWSDEFEGTAVNTAKWDFRTGTKNDSSYPCYMRPENNSVSGGVYRLHLKKESYGGEPYTSGGIISKEQFRYGYYEATMRTPPGAGWHTSFWMYKYYYDAGVELDVIENDSADPYKYLVNIHSWRENMSINETFGTLWPNTVTPLTEFHVYGCEYLPDTINYYRDGMLVQTVDVTQFPHADMNIWLTSLAALIHGTTAVDDSQLPAEAQFGYCRFFELGPHATVEITSPDKGGVTVVGTNSVVELAAAATTVDTPATPDIIWSKQSGPGDVIFADESSLATGVRFAAEGLYELTCSAIIGSVTNSDAITINVNHAVTVTLQHGVGGYDNPCTFIRGDLSTFNSGADNEMIIGRWAGKGLRGLMSFDMSALDENAVILDADLHLYNYNGVGTVNTLELRELSNTFVEGTGTGGGSGSGTGATWYSRTGSENWVTAGGDFYPAVLSSIPGYNATIVGYKTFSSTPVFVTAAQDALDAGQPLNLIISSPLTESGGSDAISRLNSDDASAENRRPALTVRYVGNYLPDVYAGPDLAGTTNAPVGLNGTADYADTVMWDALSGPGAVLFSDAGTLTNTATFSMPGKYWLRLSGSNAKGTGFQDISVSVADNRSPFEGLSVSNGNVVLEVNSVPGLTYVLKTTTNLTGSWTDLYTTNAISDPMFFEFPATNGAGFYRFELMP